MRYEHDGASQRPLVGLFGSHHQPELRAELEVSGAADLRRVREQLSAALNCLADTMTVRPRSATVTFRVVEATPRGFASSIGRLSDGSGVEPRRREDLMREGQLARAFVEFSDTLVRDYDVVEFLSRLCQRSVELLEVTAAGALLTDGARRLQVVAASTETVMVLETLQIQGREGPCVDAYRSGRQVAAPDLRRTARRWPVFTPVIGRDLYDSYRGVASSPTDHRDRPDPGVAASTTRTRRAATRDVTATAHR